jgi:flagellar motor protein MotB
MGSNMSRYGVLLVMALGACVSKGRLELLEVQLDATRSAVSARAAQQAEDERDLQSRVTALEEEVILRQAQLDLLRMRESLNEEALSAARADLAIARAALVDASGAVVVVPEPAEPVEAILLQRRLASAQEAFAGLSDRATLEVRGSHLVVVVPLSRLVQEGWTTLSPRGDVLIADLAGALRAVPGVPVRVEGHTDAVPRHSASFPSNWERGFGQALIVLRGLEAEAVPVQLSVASLAGTRLLAGIGDDDPRQQRVELWIDLSSQAQQSFEATPEEPEG